jgi:hypothetical protein
LDFPEPAVIVEKEDCSTNVWALGLLALALAFAIGLVAMGKPSAKEKTKAPTPIEVLRTQVEELDLKVEKAEAAIKKVDNKCQVLGGIINNNFHAVKYNKTPDGFVFVTKNWRMDKIPPHLSVEDKEKYKEEYVEE